MAILYTWRLNCRKRQLSSDMHLPRDQVCEFKARHPLCWATASLTPQFCVRNQHMHLCNTGKRQESKRRVVMEGLLRWLRRLHTETLAGAGEGGAELGTSGEHTWCGADHDTSLKSAPAGDRLPPVSQSLHGLTTPGKLPLPPLNTGHQDWGKLSPSLPTQRAPWHQFVWEAEHWQT